ncbi:MAG TPA: AMP-binding protein [Solirubrobacterales bacterium]|jgi:acyl-CoA synthetase (AMP-forming)/AMP-acid ligase II|nr:AMP-binding protein [Solirubrobacterales bacterium]
MPLPDPKVSRWLPDPDAEPPLRDLTVGALLDETIAKWPDQEAIVFSAYDDLGVSVRWTYAELGERARRVGRALIASGIEPGERFGIWATNLPEWLELQFGAAYAGAVIVPMNPLYRASEVEFVLAKARAAACFVLPEDRGASLWDIAAKAAAGIDDVRLLVPLGEARDGSPSWEEWLATGDAVGEDKLERRRQAVGSEDTSQIQFTSGTTGFPKGAELSHGGIVNNARIFAHKATLRENGRHSNPMPYFHCGGCVMATLGSVYRGITQLPAIKFEPGRINRTIEEERATSVSLVPTMMIALEEEVVKSGRDLSSLEVVVGGGSPVPPEVMRRWIENYGIGMANTYGMTECSPVICETLPGDPIVLQTTTVGPPLPHIEVEIVAPGTTDPVPVGVEGELRSRSSMVMKGYWDNPEETAAAIDPDGFMRSGDLAKIDENGYVSITGRAKEMIIRGGENIFPAEIEHAVRALDQVADVAVIGVPDDRYGEVCCAYVRLAEGQALAEGEFRLLLTGRVARYKIPAYLRTVDELPLTPSGKVQKFKLKELFDGG